MLVLEPESKVVMTEVRKEAVHTFRGRPLTQGMAKAEV